MAATGRRSPQDTSQYPPEAHLLGLLDAARTGDPSAYIERQEAAGQQELLRSSVLPSDAPWDALADLGFVRGPATDDLFCQVTLPDGWRREGSDHAMHSYVVDERGIKRVGVFYKAAFYDRKADAHIVSVGYGLATHVLYGDDPVALPEEWLLLTAAERGQFWERIDGMRQDIANCPQVYGEYRPRVDALLALKAGAE